MQKERAKTSNRLIVLIVIVVIFLLIKGISKISNNNSEDYHHRFEVEKLILTKHAKCRMGCRNITVQEIKEIISEGKINWEKSGIGSQGDSTFALEGISEEKQHIRVVVAPEKDGLVVITCIDLDRNWACDCD
jgi:hypothetical protein